jgi:tRNA A-37 threonylcarbamoyl transferase component Bud32
MAESRKMIARRSPSTSARREDTSTPARMPEEMLFEGVQRLVFFSGIAAVLWSFALLLDAIVLPLAGASPPTAARTRPIEAAGALISVAMWLNVRSSGARVHATAKCNVGLAFMIVNAVGVAVLNAWAAPPYKGEVLHFSWITVLILVYSMIAPSTPRRMLVGSLVAASMDPLAFAGVYLVGTPTLSPLDVFVLCWPNFACAVIATLPSRILQRLGRRLREAQELGSYELVELLGHGGMGEVWRARHRLLARDAAIKLVRPEVLGARNDADARTLLRRFEREAQATAVLSSPHTIQLFDFGATQEGSFYYVMELLMGRDLETLVREFGPLSANRTIYLLRQVCHSLADAHARGLVHRDIKPANIYVCRMGLEYDFIKVLDFGLVKFKDSSGGTHTLSLVDHTTTGTPAYMAPETILGEANVDRRADVYALGCVAYYLLTGQLVFEGDAAMKVLLQHVHAQPVPPSQRTELPIPRELDELVMKCLEKDPARRPQDARELFAMACGCHACDEWTPETARLWWEVHLPEFTGPLTIGDPGPAAAPASVAVG